MKQNSKYFGRNRVLDALFGTASYPHWDAYTLPQADSTIIDDKPRRKRRILNLMVSGKMAYPLFFALTRMDNRPKEPAHA